MFRLIGKILNSRIAVPLLVAVAAWQGWMVVRPKPFPLDARRRELTEAAAAEVARSLPAPASGRPTVAVARFEGDSTGFVTDAVRRAVDRAGRYAVQPADLVENLRDELGLEQEALSPDAIAGADLGTLDADYALVGRVARLAATEETEEAVLEGVLIALRETAPPVRVTGRAGDAAESGRPQSGVRAYPWPARLASWLALVVLLPLVLIPLTGRGLAAESNAANLAMLLGLALVAGLAAYAMLGFRVDTWWAAALLVVGTMAALAYDWLMLSKQERLRSA
ncbi:MAG: hypothetical protein AMK73_07775 [Planctomycetes bacterium SM23_32]|nr:MAG: hypothetical protein AMK73_07775 [Planctomycetes bacterium SM23_32]